MQALKFPLKFFAISLISMFNFNSALAGDLEPRTYVNTPVGLNFLIVGYNYTEGGLSTNALPIEDAEMTIDTGILAYARTLDVWGNSGKFDVIIPYSDLSGTSLFDGQPREREVSGFHDPRFRWSVNFYGSPALSIQEFAKYQQDLIVGASVQVSVPLGRYDPQKLVNLGTNRWFIKPEIGISKAFGPLTLEFSESVTFFTRDDEYLGSNNLDQAPLYTTQAHLTYSFGRGIWAALDMNYDYGGHTTLNGVEGDNKQSNSRFGATLALPIDRNHSLKLHASTGVSTRIGSDFDLYGIFWQYRWGEGL
jgi:hypothetical protein